MRIRAIVTFAIVVFAAAVGLAMTSSGGSSDWRPVVQDQQQPPDGPPPPPPGMHRRGGPGGFGPMLFDLDLTAEQIEQVRSLMKADRDASASYHEKLRNLDQQIRAAVESDSFKEDSVRALAEQEAAISVELRVLGARTQAAIDRLLTADQKKALADQGGQQPRPRRGGRGHDSAGAGITGGLTR